MNRDEIRKQAEMLARENRESDPEISRIYWFPSDEQIRLVELHESIPPSGDAVHPFYFHPSPRDGLTAPSGIALIRPSEYKTIKLPEGWGEWENAEEIPVAK